MIFSNLPGRSGICGQISRRAPFDTPGATSAPDSAGKTLSRSKMARFGRSFRSVKCLRRFREAQTLEIAQSDGRAIPLGELLHAGLQPFQPFLLFDSGQRRRL